MTEIAGSVGSEIKRLRRALGMSQDRFAQALGYNDHGTVSRWELGKVVPCAAMLERIRKRFDAQITAHDVDLGATGAPFEDRLGRLRRIDHENQCDRCGASIPWVEYTRDGYEPAPGAPGDEGTKSRFRLCAPCTAQAFHFQAIRRRANDRYDALRAVGLL